MSRPATAPGIGTPDRPRRWARLERARPRSPWDALPPRSRDNPEVRRRLQAWLDQGYRRSSGGICPARLADRRCVSAAAHDAWASVWRTRPYAAHPQLWRCAARLPALTCHPSTDPADWLAVLEADTARWGLQVRVLPDASWWNPGHPLIVLTRPEWP